MVEIDNIEILFDNFQIVCMQLFDYCFKICCYWCFDFVKFEVFGYDQLCCFGYVRVGWEIGYDLLGVFIFGYGLCYWFEIVEIVGQWFVICYWYGGLSGFEIGDVVKGGWNV